MRNDIVARTVINALTGPAALIFTSIRTPAQNHSCAAFPGATANSMLTRTCVATTATTSPRGAGTLSHVFSNRRHQSHPPPLPRRKPWTFPTCAQQAHCTVPSQPRLTHVRPPPDRKACMRQHHTVRAKPVPEAAARRSEAPQICLSVNVILQRHPPGRAGCALSSQEGAPTTEQSSTIQAPWADLVPCAAAQARRLVLFRGAGAQAFHQRCALHFRRVYPRPPAALGAQGRSCRIGTRSASVRGDAPVFRIDN